MTLIVCPECDQVTSFGALPAHARVACPRCGAVLHRHLPHGLATSLALAVAALVLFVIANTFPLVSLQVGGREQASLLVTGAIALHGHGMGETGLVILLTSIVFPLLAILNLLWLLVPVALGRRPPAMGVAQRCLDALAPWSLVAVFMLGLLIAIVKLQDLATVVPGIALYAFVGLQLAFSAARANLDRHALWQAAAPDHPAGDRPASVAGLVGCPTCTHVMAAMPADRHCPRCHQHVEFRHADSLQRTAAYATTAALMLVPANALPVMTITKLGQGEPNTILSGVVYLIAEGMWGLGLIVLFASIVVPVLKLVTLAWLMHSVARRSTRRTRDRAVLYRVTEVVGAWSMVDVFLVGVLCGVVSLGALATVTPGLGASFFAAAVILTMLAAHSFDPRLIWDAAGRNDARLPTAARRGGPDLALRGVPG